jgi:RNA polymerase sigma factor (sigma-70 family)
MFAALPLSRGLVGSKKMINQEEAMDLLEIMTKCRTRQEDYSYETYCLELFRRAIVEKDQVAWLFVHEQYFRLVYYWIAQMDMPDTVFIEDLAQDAFLSFWRAYTPEKLDQAQNLGSILSYLKECAISTVIQARRTVQKQRREEAGWHLWETQENQRSTASNGESLWQRIVERCQSEQEYFLAQLFYVSGLKPREIAEQYPDRFVNVQEVYRIQRNLVERLRRDPILNFMRENEENGH